MIELTVEGKKISDHDIKNAWQKAGFPKELGNVEVLVDVFSKKRVISEDLMFAILDLEGAAWKRKKMKFMVVKFHDGEGYKIKIKIRERGETNEDIVEERAEPTG